MAKRSAGLLAYRRRNGRLEVLLVHPGGPYWRNKDNGAWSIPKGEHGPDEDAFAAACREFREETSWPLPVRADPVEPTDGPGAIEQAVAREPGDAFIPVGEATLASGKVVRAWAFEGDFNPATLRSNTFTFEWPRGSGRLHEYPEVDRADWFPLDEARLKMHPAQTVFLDRLEQHLETREG